MGILKAIRGAYKAEPIIINAVLTCLAAIAARYGFDIDLEVLVPLVFGTNLALGRSTVYAPDSVEDMLSVQKAILSTPSPQVAPTAPQAAPGPEDSPYRPLVAPEGQGQPYGPLVL